MCVIHKVFKLKHATKIVFSYLSVQNPNIYHLVIYTKLLQYDLLLRISIRLYNKTI